MRRWIDKAIAMCVAMSVMAGTVGCGPITASTVAMFVAKEAGKKVVKKAIKDHKEKKAAEDASNGGQE